MSPLHGDPVGLTYISHQSASLVQYSFGETSDEANMQTKTMPQKRRAKFIGKPFQGFDTETSDLSLDTTHREYRIDQNHGTVGLATNRMTVIYPIFPSRQQTRTKFCHDTRRQARSASGRALNRRDLPSPVQRK